MADYHDPITFELYSQTNHPREYLQQATQRILFKNELDSLTHSGPYYEVLGVLSDLQTRKKLDLPLISFTIMR